MTAPTRAEFIEKAKQGNLIPVWREVLADMETPVSAYRKIAGGRAELVSLESVEGGERLARYSFLGTDPFLIFRSKGETATITEGGQTETLTLSGRVAGPAARLERAAGALHLCAVAGAAAVCRRRGRDDRLRHGALS